MNLKTIVFCIVLGVTTPLAYLAGRLDSQRHLDALKAGYALQDREDAAAVSELVRNLHLQCEERIEAAQHNYGKG